MKHRKRRLNGLLQLIIRRLRTLFGSGETDSDSIRSFAGFQGDQDESSSLRILLLGMTETDKEIVASLTECEDDGTPPDLVFIGGFSRNPEEKILKGTAFGCPVIFGPKIARTDEAYEIMSIAGGLTADNPTSFIRIVNRLLHDPEERRRRGVWIKEWQEYYYNNHSNNHK